jgi:hypothetical protein
MELNDNTIRPSNLQEGYVVPEPHIQTVRERRAKYIDGLPKGKTFDQIEAEIRRARRK